MKANIKNQNGAISLFVLISMMFFLTFMLGAFTLVNRRNASQVESLSQLQKIYSSKPQADDIYDAMFADDNSVIPITNLELLKKAKEVNDNNTTYNCFVDGKIYTYKKGAIYALKNDITITLDEYTDKQDLIDNEYIDYVVNLSRYKINTDNHTIYYEKADKSLAKLDRILFNKAKDIAEYNANIGKAVNYEKSYTTPTGISQDWEILYADNNYVYLIAKEFLSDDGFNTGPVSGNTYGGTNDFLDSTKLKKYPAVKDGWLYKIYDNENVLYPSSNNNMKATEYMLDSTNAKWSGLKNSYAKWVIGGPTLELLVASYNAVNPTNTRTIADFTANATGYARTLEYGTLPNTTQSGVAYNPWNHNKNYWIAGPSSQDAPCVLAIFCDGAGVGMSASYTAQRYSFRPVVCLKSDVTLKWDIDHNKYDLILDKEYDLAEDISKNSSNIGKAVNYGKSYTTASGPKSDWEILYADNDNVYIISKDCLPAYSFTNFVENENCAGYNGSSDFTNLNTTKYPAIEDGWLNKLYGKTWAGGNRESTKITEFILDSTNSNWSGLKNSYAKWVIGGPTLELLTASYNKVNPSTPMVINDINPSDMGLSVQGEVNHSSGELPNTNNQNVIYNP